MKHAILRPSLFDWLEKVRLSERLNGVIQDTSFGLESLEKAVAALSEN